MAAIQRWQVRKIYSIGGALGLKGASHDREDALHTLVAGLTGKESIAALTYAEAEVVVVELETRQKAAGITPPSPRPSKKAAAPTRPGGVTVAQQCKMWALIGELEKLDSPNPAKVKGGHRQRLCGAIKAATGMDAAPAKPFEWMQMDDGRTVIDFLVRLVASEKAKAIREGRVEHG